MRALWRHHAPTVAFGFLLAFLSSFGQTYFIALSVPDIRAAFGLSHAEFGSIFSVATLLSGLLMIWAGSSLDRMSVRAYAAMSLAGLAAAALALSFASTLLALGAAVFALRLFGQGMLSHAAVTSTARLPEGVRGRAIGLATLGFQAGTGVFPALGVVLITAFGWLATWQIAAAMLACFAVAAFPYRRLGRGADRTHATAAGPAPLRQRRRDLLRDWRFLVLMPTMFGPAAVSTGYFFHQRLIAELKGWSLDLLALGVTVTAAASIVASLGSGWLVDRLGAVRLTRIQLLPLAAASVALGMLAGPVSAVVFFALMGLTTGASGVILTAALAEMYGTAQLGTIRAVAAAVMVIASASTPWMMGYAFDAGVGLLPIGLACASYLVLASMLNLRLPVRR